MVKVQMLRWLNSPDVRALAMELALRCTEEQKAPNATTWIASLLRRPSTGSGTSITRRPSTGSQSSSDDLSSKGHGVQVDTLRVAYTTTVMKSMTAESSRTCADLSSNSTPASWHKRLVKWQMRLEALGKKVEVCRKSSKDRVQRRLSHFNGRTAIQLETVCPACCHVICTSQCLGKLTSWSTLRSWIKYIIRNKKIHRSEQDCPDLNLLQSSGREAEDRETKNCPKSQRAYDDVELLQSSSDGMDLEIDSEEDENLTEKFDRDLRSSLSMELIFFSPTPIRPLFYLLAPAAAARAEHRGLFVRRFVFAVPVDLTCLSFCDVLRVREGEFCRQGLQC